MNNEIDEIDCLHCQHNGQQSIYPSSCTGCGAFGEYRNFKPKEKAVKKYTTADLVSIALELRLILKNYQPNDFILMTKTAGELKAVCNDYIKLRYQKGISKYE